MEVAVGGVTVALQLDTGSSDLAVPTRRCCKAGRSYEPSPRAGEFSFGVTSRLQWPRGHGLRFERDLTAQHQILSTTKYL